MCYSISPPFGHLSVIFRASVPSVVESNQGNYITLLNLSISRYVISLSLPLKTKILIQWKIPHILFPIYHSTIARTHTSNLDLSNRVYPHVSLWILKSIFAFFTHHHLFSTTNCIHMNALCLFLLSQICIWANNYHYSKSTNWYPWHSVISYPIKEK